MAGGALFMAVNFSMCYLIVFYFYTEMTPDGPVNHYGEYLYSDASFPSRNELIYEIRDAIDEIDITITGMFSASQSEFNDW